MERGEGRESRGFKIPRPRARRREEGVDVPPFEGNVQRGGGVERVVAPSVTGKKHQLAFTRSVTEGLYTYPGRSEAGGRKAERPPAVVGREEGERVWVVPPPPAAAAAALQIPWVGTPTRDHTASSTVKSTPPGGAAEPPPPPPPETRTVPSRASGVGR